MNTEHQEIDINQYIDALLWSQPQPKHPTAKHINPLLNYETDIVQQDHSLPQIQQIHKQQDRQPIIIEKVSDSSVSDGVKSKDYLKNMYNNSLKYIVKRYISARYQRRVDRIHRKVGIKDGYAAKLYYRQRQQQTIGLTNLCNLLNYNQGTQEERQYKRAFHMFYVWFMRRQYPIHILKTGKLQHSQVYWRAKNILVYLPSVKKESNKQQMPLQETASISITQISNPMAMNDNWSLQKSKRQ